MHVGKISGEARREELIHFIVAYEDELEIEALKAEMRGELEIDLE